MPLLEENPFFTGRPETRDFAGILFDMDGTIVDSTDAIVKHWHKQRIRRGSRRDIAVFTREEIDRHVPAVRFEQGQLGV
ncbi:MAG: hypothetical protein Q9175_002734 [Cornicularia normoerica]